MESLLEAKKGKSNLTIENEFYHPNQVMYTILLYKLYFSVYLRHHHKFFLSHSILRIRLQKS